MNRNVALLIGATVGAGAGYFVAAVVADYIEEKEIRDQAPVVVDEEEEQPTDDEEESSSGKPAMSKKRKVKRERVNYTNYFQSVDRPDLAALARKYNEGEDNTDHIDKVSATLVALAEQTIFEQPKPDPNAITIISRDEFMNNPDDFEIVDLSYYADEIMVGEEDDNIIPGPEDIIGDDALVSFGMLSGDPDVVYVRNPKTRALYEVVRMSVKYAIDADADQIIPRKGKKKGIDFDEVTDEETNEEAAS